MNSRLTPPEIHASLSYYFIHQQKVGSELSAELSALNLADKHLPPALRLCLLATGHAYLVIVDGASPCKHRRF